MNCQCDNQRRRDFAEVSRCVRVEVTGRAGRANVMDIFADEEEQRVSRRRGQHCCPPTAVAETFGQNREERYAQECSGCQTDQRTKRFVRQSQRRADPSADKGESVGRDDLPQSQLAVQELVSDS